MTMRPSGLLLDQVHEKFLPAVDRLEERQVPDVPPAVYEPWIVTPRRDDPEPPEELSQPAEDVRVSASPAPAYAGYVLAVDDEPAIRTALHDLLDDEGYSVVEAADGVEALKSLRSTHDRYVVLLDYLMPRMNGLEVLRAVTSDPVLAKQHSFILITANILSLQDEVRALLAQHGIPLLAKPFHWSTVIRAVEQAAQRLASS